jgi:hypothetical protein
MAETPTRSLRTAPNAAARMQEVLRRPAGTSPTPEEELSGSPTSHATALPDISTTALPVAQIGSSAVGSATDEKTETTPAKPRRSQPPTPPEKASVTGSAAIEATTLPDISTTALLVAQIGSSAVGSATGSDPVRQAMLGMLGMPYPEDMAEGMMTVTSVKIPKPIWERLEYARTLTKKDKQDIIAEALRLYFDRIVEGIGE